MRLINNIQIELDEREILRLLSSKKGNLKKQKKVSNLLLEQIHEIKESALEIIQPIGIYDVFDSTSLTPAFLFNKSEKTVLAVCTIGKELEVRSSLFISKGELSKGVIIDSIASHAAEKTAEYVNKIILDNLKDEIGGKLFTSRFSPGYCQWELDKGQEMIFNLVDTKKIGVSLSDSKMMQPIKSVSFAINIGKKIDQELGERGCETCDMVNCAYRRVRSH